MNSQAVINPANELDFLAELTASAIDTLDYSVTQALNSLRSDDSLNTQVQGESGVFIYEHFIYKSTN